MGGGGVSPPPLRFAQTTASFERVLHSLTGRAAGRPPDRSLARGSNFFSGGQAPLRRNCRVSAVHAGGNELTREGLRALSRSPGAAWQFDLRTESRAEVFVCARPDSVLHIAPGKCGHGALSRSAFDGPSAGGPRPSRALCCKGGLTDRRVPTACSPTTAKRCALHLPPPCDIIQPGPGLWAPYRSLQGVMA